MATVKTYYKNGRISKSHYTTVYDAENHARCILDYKTDVSKVEVYNNSDDRVLIGFGHMEA